MRKRALVIISLSISLLGVVGCGGAKGSEVAEVIEPTETTETLETLEILETTEVKSTEVIAETETEEDNKLFNPDKVGSNRDNFWFEDQATIDYLMGISGVSELPEEQLSQFMSDIAEMVYIDEFGGDIGKIEDYIQTVLPVYQQQSSTTKNSSNADTKANNNSSTKSNTANINQETQTPSTSESTPSNNTDSSTNYIDESQINNNLVGPDDSLFGRDEGADWGEYDSNAPSANWQY